MPAKNTVRMDTPQSYYHIYARGVDKRQIFLNEQDKNYFISLFKRYLSLEQQKTKGRLYPNYSQVIELLAYCLMNNHFHLLVYQDDYGSVSNFMKSLMTSYSRYFNLKYKRTGALFETKFRASRISNDSYLLHISRYIHLNPRRWEDFEYSSIRDYLHGEKSDWLTTSKIKGLYANTGTYFEFLSDYEDHKAMLDQLKAELADT